MKIPVLTAKDVEFRNWCFWTDWIDIAVFDYGHDGYLLQMKVNRFNGKRFICRKFRGAGVAVPSVSQVEELLPMNHSITRELKEIQHALQ